MRTFLLILVSLGLSACGTVQKVQYSALEKVGIHKRDILVDRIEETSQVQEQTKTQFKSAYEELAGLVQIKDGGLESKYRRMAKAVEASNDKAEELDDRIDSVNEVANALFAEWKQELEQYQSVSLRQASEKNLQTTRQRYGIIYQKMRESQQRVGPVLEVLQDNTLYLKHNLNARAISSISNEVLVIEDKVALLISQMELSISESDEFIKSMRSNQ